MILRVCAALALLLGAGALTFYLWWVGKTPFSSAADRHLRVMKERTAVPERYEAFTFADFESLPHARPLAEYAVLERRAVSVVGYVQSMFLSLDGDFHLAVIEQADSTRWIDVAGITAELTPQFQRGSTRWTLEPLHARLRPFPRSRPYWPGGPRRARISGWLLYDFQYDAPYVNTRPQLTPPSGRPRMTAWEIHPVTRIELWDDSLQAFVEYPR